MNYHNYYYPESRFGGFTDIDGTIIFYTRINALIKPEFVIVDYGCGTGSYMNHNVTAIINLRSIKGKSKKIIGIDIDDAARSNQNIDEFKKIESDRWPIESDSADMIICDFVLEHLQTPEEYFREAKRVLKKDGYMCIRTPNLMSYFGILVSLIPKSFHGWLIGRLQPGRDAADVFPKFNRCNTIRKIGSHLKSNGFDGCVYGFESEPRYFDTNRVLYLFGVVLQRLMPKFLKISIFSFSQKT